MQEAEYYKNEYEEMLISKIKENSIALNQLSAAFKIELRQKTNWLDKSFILLVR